MALGDLMTSNYDNTNSIEEFVGWEEDLTRELEGVQIVENLDTSTRTSGGSPYLPQNVVLCDFRHDGFEERVPLGPAENGLVSKWRPKDRMKTGCVALVLCLNIGVDPPDAIKISPCARLECWIDPYSLPPPKALDTIGKALHAQCERWQPWARYKP